MVKTTSSRAALLATASSLEQSANDADNLRAWAMLGQMDKALSMLDRAATIRRAAEISSLSARRQFLRAAGIEA